MEAEGGSVCRTTWSNGMAERDALSADAHRTMWFQRFRGARNASFAGPRKARMERSKSGKGTSEKEGNAL